MEAAGTILLIASLLMLKLVFGVSVWVCGCVGGCVVVGVGGVWMCVCACVYVCGCAHIFRCCSPYVWCGL